MMLSYLMPKVGDVIGMILMSNINTGHFLASCPPQNVIIFYKKKIYKFKMRVFLLIIREITCQYIPEFKMSVSLVTIKTISTK